MLIVYQDGREFYSLDPSVTNPIYRAPVRVPDGDIRAAHEARQHFENHMAVDHPRQAWRWETAADRSTTKMTTCNYWTARWPDANAAFGWSSLSIREDQCNAERDVRERAAKHPFAEVTFGPIPVNEGTSICQPVG